ncbi:hypothetical protein LCGC14_2807810, partial [marine sediment metagenome]
MANMRLTNGPVLRSASALAWAAALTGAVASVGMAAEPGGGVRVTADRPRLVFRPKATTGARTFEQLRDLYKANGGDNAFAKEVGSWIERGDPRSSPISDAIRYVATGDVALARRAVDHMAEGRLRYRGTETRAEEGIWWALSYDWVHAAWPAGAPADVKAKLRRAETRIARYIVDALRDLDGNYPSLWHGRAAVGAAVWIGALALPHDKPLYDSLRKRAWGHWQQALKAARAGAWPEGVTYWG